MSPVAANRIKTGLVSLFVVIGFGGFGHQFQIFLRVFILSRLLFLKTGFWRIRTVALKKYFLGVERFDLLPLQAVSLCMFVVVHSFYNRLRAYTRLVCRFWLKR